MGLAIRWVIADFLNVGTPDAPNWALCGTGFNSLNEQPNAQVQTSKYINSRATTKNIIGYETVFPFDIDTFQEEAAIMKIYDIARNQRTGADAVVEYVRTDFLADAAGKPIDTAVPARKFRVAVEVSEFSGGGLEALKIAGNLNGQGDFVDGTFDVKDRIFTPKTVPGVLTIGSTAGSSAGKTKLTVSPPLLSGNSYVYRIDASAPATPAAGEDLSTWTGWNGTVEITATNGYTITVAEVDGTKKCVKAGQATIVAG